MPATSQPTLPLTVAPTPDPLPPVEFHQPSERARLYHVVDSPVGDLLLTGDGQVLTGLWMESEPAAGDDWRREPGAFVEVEAQLRAYFAGELREFSVPLAPRGTDFQRQVWRQLTTIPFGVTASYGEIAAELGRPSASRAVGMANGRNPISIIVPCHRVIGADGSLTGYGGGLPRKRHLLGLEGSAVR